MDKALFKIGGEANGEDEAVEDSEVEMLLLDQVDASLVVDVDAVEEEICQQTL